MSQVEEQVWKGADSLKQYLRPISEVPDHGQNARKGDVPAIAASLERFGQVRAVLVDEGPGKPVVTVAGHHVKKAAASLGWTHIAVIPHDFEVSSDTLAYMLADNRLSELGEMDVEQQISLIEELAAQSALEGTGHTLDDAEDMRAQLNLISESEPEFRGGYSESQEEIARRQEEMAKGQARREVVLMLAPEQHAEFTANVRELQKRWDESSAVQTIVRAVAEAIGLPDAPGDPE